MITHKEISHKVRGPTCSENARHFLVWLYRERCVHILYAFWAYYTECLRWFCNAKASLRPPLHHTICSLVKTWRMRHGQDTAHTWWGVDCDLQPNEKKKNEARISTRAFPLESPSKSKQKPKKQWKQNKAMVNSAKYETTARARDAFCPFTQTWRVNCPFSFPITLSNYKHDTFNFLLMLKSGWWLPATFENFLNHSCDYRFFWFTSSFRVCHLDIESP